MKSSEHCALVTSTHSPCSSSLCTQGWVGTAPREAEIPSPSQKRTSGLLLCLEQKEWEGERNRRNYMGRILLEKLPSCIFYLRKKGGFFFPQPPSKFTLSKHRPFQKKKKIRRRIELEGHGRGTEEIKQRRLFREGMWFNTLQVTVTLLPFRMTCPAAS